jgi:mannan endo-1,4-beta-mannosidase
MIRGVKPSRWPAFASAAVIALAGFPTTPASQEVSTPPPPADCCSLRVEKTHGETILSWESIINATAYDVVRGELGILRTTGGDFSEATRELLCDDCLETTLPHAEDPITAEGYWYLVRGVHATANGTFDAGEPSQVGLRDSEIDNSCIDGFLRRNGYRFEHLCEPMYFAGFNNYYQMVYAADLDLRHYVDEVQQEAAQMGLTVMRTWAFNDGADEWNALQTSPGVYQEHVFVGLDDVLEKARQNGLKVILTLVNNWDDYGGMNQYVEWSATASSHDDFYTDPDCRQWYKDYIASVLTRTNTLNGRVYMDDPTIFAWELANEPWCQSDSSGDTLQEWIETMSSHLKSIDSKHLLTIGSEGFYGTAYAAKNPRTWMDNVGVDFVRNHLPSTIDFAVFHSWPDHWGIGYASSMQWARDHIQDAESLLEKPVVMEEFGKERPLATRDSYYQGWYDVVYDSASQGLAAGGSLFWILYHDDYTDYDGFGVYYPDDASTIEIIETEAEQMNGL